MKNTQTRTHQYTCNIQLNASVKMICKSISVSVDLSMKGNDANLQRNILICRKFIDAAKCNSNATNALEPTNPVNLRANDTKIMNKSKTGFNVKSPGSCSTPGGQSQR